MALSGSALAVLMMAPSYETTGFPRMVAAARCAALAGLGEARRRGHARVMPLGLALLGVAGVKRVFAPRVSFSKYESAPSDHACALLRLGGFNQIANVAYLLLAGKKSHKKGLLAAILVNAAACLRFGLFDGPKAGYEAAGSIGYSVMGLVLAAVVSRA